MHVIDTITEADVGNEQCHQDHGHDGEDAIQGAAPSLGRLDHGPGWRMSARTVDVFHGSPGQPCTGPPDRDELLILRLGTVCEVKLKKWTALRGSPFWSALTAASTNEGSTTCWP